MNIGVFDSGLGGLAIFKEILKLLPQYNYIYLGDNARVPYGGRSADLIYGFTKNAMDFLFKKNCKLIIIACNTATANALQRLQLEYLPKYYPDRRILGVIRPVVEEAINIKPKRLGIMATRATVNSNSYPEEIFKLDPTIKVIQQACPLLVPIIEENEIGWEGLDLIIKKYLAPLLKEKIDSLILGCTHYGLIIDKIKKHLDKNIKIISQGEATAKKLKDYLDRHSEITNKLGKNNTQTYFATDLNQNYQKLTQLFLEEYFTDKTTLNLINF